MQNPEETSSTASFVFRLIAFLLFLTVGVAGFASLAYQRFVNPEPAAAAQINAQAAPTVTPSPTATPNDAVSRPVSEPYTGDLSIFESPEREKNLQIFRVMDILGIGENSNVADIGAGSGWFTTRAAKRATKGTVYAVEINQDYLNYIDERAKKEKLPNIKTVLDKGDNATLADNSVDAVLILKTYHEIEQPIRLLEGLKKSMRPKAKLGIIDRNGAGDDHGIEQQQVVKEAEQAGFKLVDKYDFVKPDGMDYFLVFQAK